MDFSFARTVALIAIVLNLLGPARLAAETSSYCARLGGRTDRVFVGRPGNLAGEVGDDPRLIYMAGTLSVKSSLLRGAVLEWRPDFVQLAPEPGMAADGGKLIDTDVAKFCWVGPQDSLLVEYRFSNRSAQAQLARLRFDLTGVTAVPADAAGPVQFRVERGFPRKLLPHFGGALVATSPLTWTNGAFEVQLSLAPAQTSTCVLAIAFAATSAEAVTKAQAACRPAARGESSDYWENRLGHAVPAFRCSDPFLEKLYYFRWYSLLTKLNVGGHGRWAKPLAREGVVGFNSLITYSGGPSTLDLRWLHSPEWAYGNVESFYDNLNAGKLANHIYPDSLDGDAANRGPGRDGSPMDFPYHNFLVRALADLYAVHPQRERLSRLWPAVQQATALYARELDADHDGLFETYPWSNITGQEYSARFLYFHPYDQQLGYGRTWRPADDADARAVAEKLERAVLAAPGLKLARTAAEMNRQLEQHRHYRQESVDQNCYAFADFQAMADLAGILSDRPSRQLWSRAAQQTRQRVLAQLWDSSTAFFYDRDGASGAPVPVKSPTGFYPFWAGIGTRAQLGIFRHLFNPAEFWTAHPVPTLSLDYLRLQELRAAGMTYWNGHNWPMTTSHVVDAAARGAKELAPDLTHSAAELFRRYTRTHFIGGDLQRPCVSEYFDPLSGKPNLPRLDYAHSYFIDLVLRHVAGIEVNINSSKVRIQPLDLGLESFEFERVRVRGHELGVRWHDGRLIVNLDGKIVRQQRGLDPFTLRIPSS